MAKEIVSQDQEAQSPRQDKPKEEHTKTHDNWNDENQRHKILKATRENDK